MKDLPTKSEVILYHGMSALQKKYYKAILTKDLGTEPLERNYSLDRVRVQMLLVWCLVAC